jgi:hypothetical protein
LEDWKESLRRHRAHCHRCEQTSQDISFKCIDGLAVSLAAGLLAACLFGVEDIASLKVCVLDKISRAKVPPIESSVGISENWMALVRDGLLSLILDSQITWLSINPLAIISYAAGLLDLQWDYDNEDGDSVICNGDG